MSRLRLAAIAGFMLVNLACASGVGDITITSPEDGAVFRSAAPIPVEVEFEGEKSHWYTVVIEGGNQGIDGDWPDRPAEWTPKSSGEWRVIATTDDKDDQPIWDDVVVTVDLPWTPEFRVSPVGDQGMYQLSASGAPEVISEATFWVDDQELGRIGFNEVLFWDSLGQSDGTYHFSADLVRGADGKVVTLESDVSVDNCEVLPPAAGGALDVVSLDDGTFYSLAGLRLDRWTRTGGFEEWLIPPTQGSYLDVGPDGTVFVLDAQTNPVNTAHLYEVDPDTGWFYEIDGAPGTMTALEVTPDGRVYVSSLDALYLWTRADGWSTAAADLPGIRDGRIFVDASNRLWWIGDTTGALHRSELDAAGNVVSTTVVLPDRRTTSAIGEDDQGRLLLLTDAGVERIDAETGDYIDRLLPTVGSIGESGFLFPTLRMTHIKHRPGCHSIVVVTRSGLGIVRSDAGGRP